MAKAEPGVDGRASLDPRPDSAMEPGRGQGRAGLSERAGQPWR
jgi:hypothetical protein